MSYEALLTRMALHDERLVVITSENRAAIRGLPSVRSIPLIDTGIAEQAAIGIAAGFALRGRIPVVHALATFLTLRAFEFIRTDVGLPRLPVKLIGGVPGFLSEGNGPTHQALEDVALMRSIPNMQIFCPSDEADILSGLEEILITPDPCYIRFNALPAGTQHAPFRIGKAEVLSTGGDVTILVYGMLLDQALEARDRMEAQGVSTGLINLRMIKPLDEEKIMQAAQQTSLLVTLEDHFLTGGLFSVVAELLLKRQQPCNVLPIALMDRWFRPSRLDEILRHEGFTGEQIAEKIISTLNRRKTHAERSPVQSILP